MNELKPCPFCGGKASVECGFLYLVECEECHASTNRFLHVYKAVNAWNRRNEDESHCGLVSGNGYPDSFNRV